MLLAAEQEHGKPESSIRSMSELEINGSKIISQVWRCVPPVPVLGSLRQEDCEFKASLET